MVFLRLLFILLTATSFVEPVKAQQACLKLFDQHKATFIFDINETKPKKLIRLAFENFENNCNVEETIQTLKSLEKNGTESISQDDVLILKKARKQFSIVRSALQITTEIHRSPKKFESFVKDFGHLNDFIATKNFTAANLLIAEINANITHLNMLDLQLSSVLSTKSSVKDYYQNLKLKIMRAFETKTISLDTYHDVRKVIREFLSLAELSDQISPSSQNKTNFNYLFRLNVRLGNMNDIFTEKMINGDYDKHNTQIKFPKKLKKEVQFFIDEMNIE